MKYICDTNFIIRYLVADNEDMFMKTKDIFDKVQAGSVSLIIEQTIFTETIFVLSSFYKVPRDEIANILTKLLTYKGIICDKEVLMQALNYYSKTNMHIVDCLLSSLYKIKNINVISFDDEFNSYLS